VSFIPCTPAGTLVMGLASSTREEAIRRLLIDAAHMPYKGWKGFQKRGYTIQEVPGIKAEKRPLWCASGLALPPT
jgi:hypothetical protein